MTKIGYKYSEEVRKNMSLAHRGQIAWNKGKKGLVNNGGFKKGHKGFPGSGRKKGCVPWIKGRKHSPETLIKLSKSHKGQHSSPKTEFKEGMVTWNKGKKLPQFSGENSPNWKGGVLKDHYGYIWIYQPNHPFCEKKGYIRRSHLVIEKNLGRFITRTEQVHHINGVKDDDRLQNLKLFASNSEHLKFHYQQRKKNKFDKFLYANHSHR